MVHYINAFYFKYKKYSLIFLLLTGISLYIFLTRETFSVSSLEGYESDTTAWKVTVKSEMSPIYLARYISLYPEGNYIDEAIYKWLMSYKKGNAVCDDKLVRGVLKHHGSKGNSYAMVALGMVEYYIYARSYFFGKRSKKESLDSEKLAIELFSEAAELGNPYGQIELAQLYHWEKVGWYEKQRIRERKKLYSMARQSLFKKASAGNPYAAATLGRLYLAHLEIIPEPGYTERKLMSKKWLSFATEKGVNNAGVKPSLM